MDKRKAPHRIDWSIALPGLGILLLLCFVFLFLHMRDATLLDVIFSDITNTFGGIFQVYVFAVLIVLVYISFSRIGSIRLGEGKPQYSTFSWISMLFCACIGSSILYWGLIEWAYYLMAPPFAYEPMGREAAEAAVGYTMFHWGLSGWASYSVAAVIIAFYYFCKKIPNLRISVSCGFTRERGLEGVGKAVDVFVIIGLSAGVAVSIALGTPMVAQGLYRLFGIQGGMQTNIVIAVFWFFLFGASAIAGIDRGIKVLSNVNIVLALGFILYVFIAGASAFIGNNLVNSTGFMLQNYLYMSFYTDPINKSGFPQAWTIFYWAWWISYVPVMGLFIAKISRGRTIRQVALGGTIMGSLGCWLFLSILGGYGLDLQLKGKFDTVGQLKSGGDYVAIVGLLDTLPHASFLIFAFIIVAFIFLATTCDSSAYILASISTKDIAGNEEPSKRNRLLWSVSLILWPIVLMAVGGLNVVKLCSVLGSIPILVIFFIMIRNFLRDAHIWVKPGL